MKIILNQNKFSIVIPCYNEEDNIRILLKEIISAIPSEYIYEIIFVDDGSSDNSLSVIKKISLERNIIIKQNSSNLGQSYSIYEGIKSASYNNVVTIDCDGQNNPRDLNLLLHQYFNPPYYDLVGGLRLKRKDSIVKIFSSKIANFIRSLILRDGCKDTGCSLKVFKRDIFLKYEYFDGMHRFIPALFSALNKKTFFIEVDHRYRQFGNSKYGTFKRAIRGIFDIYKVLLITRNIKNND